jgi:Reverse transcriptase (RNA-dependent DNA polymerase)
LFGALTGYSGPDRYIISKNLKSASLNPTVLTEKVSADLFLRRIREVHPKPPGPFISSPLGLVPKPDNKWRTIHHLSYPPRESVNDSIDEEAAHFKYTSFEKVLSMVLKAGRHCIMLKCDMKDAFRMIPIAPQHHWLMGSTWDGKFYVEQVLSFGLRTAPLIFNLLAEAWEWIVRSYLRWHLIEHYLDDMMAAFPILQRKQLAQFKKDYPQLCDIAGILRNNDMWKARLSNFLAGW